MEETINLEKLKQNELLKAMIESGLIVDQGVRLSGMGIVNKNLKKLNELIDKSNLKMYYLEKRIAGTEQSEENLQDTLIKINANLRWIQETMNKLYEKLGGN